MLTIAQKYQPRLSQMFSLCDTNYALLQKVMANDFALGTVQSVVVTDFLTYTLSVKELTRYTSLIVISQEFTSKVKSINHISDEKVVVNVESTSNDQWLSLLQPSMDIRLYHDARMAEVVSWQNIRQIKPRYDYPNKNMHLPDEKHQINIFLKECLQLCCRQGRVHISLCNIDG